MEKIKTFLILPNNSFSSDIFLPFFLYVGLFFYFPPLSPSVPFLDCRPLSSFPLIP